MLSSKTASNASSEVDRVKQGVLSMIRNREILPGQRLDQRRLAKQLESTTAPLREALSSLEAEHVLVRERGLGVFCRSYTVKEIEEMIEIRGVLEGLAARWAVPHLTPVALDELTRLAEELERPFEPEGEQKFVETHVAFHRKVLALSQSGMLASLMDRHYFIDSIIANVAPLLWRVEPHDHHTVVEAIASGDPEKAEAAMRNHIAPTFKERLEKLRSLYGMGPILQPT
jgi:DNA-binding GntR family transcriptional regulator